jgi:hypothetical protein
VPWLSTIASSVEMLPIVDLDFVRQEELHLTPD